MNQKLVDMNSLSINSPPDVTTYSQKGALSMLDLIVFRFSLLDLVTKLASPFCRRLL